MEYRTRTHRPVSPGTAAAAWAFCLGAVFSLGFPLGLAADDAAPSAGGLKVPAEFEIVPVAGPPLIERPISADFDEQGRLYVSDSSGSNEKSDVQLEKRPHRIVRLVDADGDGRFDRATTFADRMMFPEGILWREGSVYCAAPPSIWKLTDRDDDGIADERLEWYQGKTLTGCANDLHGPYSGLDGWIYWCKGAFAKQTHERPGRTPLVTRAAHIFRARPDGTGVEAVMTGGMDNPVDVVFSSAGERFLTSTFLQNPGGGKRDGLIHAVYGGVYGKDHDVVEEHPRTGALMPAMTHLGPAAPCGLLRCASSGLGADFEGNLLACLFNLRKVTRHVLLEDGATFRTIDQDLVTSDSPDFHPTDVIEDADGSVLVVDTGGWYKLCCPTSQLSKPDVLGTIYRLRRRGAARIDDPRGLQLAWDGVSAADLARRLDDDRFAVRDRAMASIAKQGKAAVPALAALLQSAPATRARVNAVWTLARIGDDSARAACRSALDDSGETVRRAAAHTAAFWRDGAAREQLLDLLRKGSPQLQRVCAEALGRLGDRAAVPGLLAAAAVEHDRFLEHSIDYALIEIGDRAGVAKALSAESYLARRAALIALDAMEGGNLAAAEVLPQLSSSEPILRETAWWIAGRHADWGAELVPYLKENLASKTLSAPAREELEARLGRLARGAAARALLSAVASDAGAALPARCSALRAMSLASVKEIPPDWVRTLAMLSGDSNSEVRRAALAVAKTLPFPREGGKDLEQALRAAAADEGLDALARLDALSALPGAIEGLDEPTFAFLLAALAPDRPVSCQVAAAGVLGRAKLGEPQLARLTGAVSQCSPLELSRLVPAFEGQESEAIGLALVSALKESPGLTGLRADVVSSLLAKYPPSVATAGADIVASLGVDLAEQKKRLDELLAKLHDGDVRRGQTVFNSTRAACSSCHAIGYLGGKVGPDLTTIGQARTDRDLLESLLYPSASFVRSYEPVVVVTKQAQAVNGVVKRDAPDELVLATGPDTEARFAREDIDEITPGTVSIMPQGLDQQLSLQEIADLLAFLKATRWGS